MLLGHLCQERHWLILLLRRLHHRMHFIASPPHKLRLDVHRLRYIEVHRDLRIDPGVLSPKLESFYESLGCLILFEEYFRQAVLRQFVVQQ